MTPAGTTVGASRRASKSNSSSSLDPPGGHEPYSAAFALRAAAAVVDAALDGRWASDELVRAASPGVPPTFRQSVCRIAVRDPRVLSLPPAVGAETVLRLVRALGPAGEVSLWIGSAREPRAYLAAERNAPTRATRESARAVIDDGAQRPSPILRAAAVVLWGVRRGALVARVSDRQPPPPEELLGDAAAVLGLLLEKEALLERSAARERELVESVERRLLRLGLDLHDGPIQDLAAAGTNLHLLRRLPTTRQGESRRLAATTGALSSLNAAYESLRRLAHSATGAGFARTRIEHVIEREAGLLAEQADIDVAVDVSGSFADLTPSQRIALARIVQEAFSNIREHSGATSVRVSLRRVGGAIRADVDDDGGGFDVDRALAQAARTGRLGLVGMSERTRLLGGTLDITSRPGGGTRISAILPEWRPIGPVEASDRPSAGAL